MKVYRLVILMALVSVGTFAWVHTNMEADVQARADGVLETPSSDRMGGDGTGPR